MLGVFFSNIQPNDVYQGLELLTIHARLTISGIRKAT